jgi:hypothetical protein
MPVDIDEFYNPIEGALKLTFADLGELFAGVIVDASMVDNPYERGGDRVLAITLKLDKPFEDDDLGRIIVASKQMQGALGRAVRRAGRRSVTEGDWLAIEYVEAGETSNGKTYKIYHVEYEVRDAGTEKSIGTGEFVENGSYQPSLFGDDE